MMFVLARPSRSLSHRPGLGLPPPFATTSHLPLQLNFLCCHMIVPMIYCVPSRGTAYGTFKA